MSWIKRNLYFLVGSTLAVLLLGLAGYYFYSKWQLNNDTFNQLNAAYSELDQLAQAKPNPGNDTVNNIEIARQQESQVRGIIESERKYFEPIAPIPNPTNKIVTKEEFASALRRTVDELQREGALASVTLPRNYGFSFENERSLTLFAPGSLLPLSVQLGEVKEICNVLYQAKVNSLDNLRREKVSADDRGGSADYLDNNSITNQMAIVTPYEISFHCFSTELAAVVSGFANNPHAFVVRALNIEPGGAVAPPEGATPGWTPPPPTTAPTTRGGLPVLVDEKQLKVTMMLNLIKLLPKK